MTENSQQILRRLLQEHELWGMAEVCEELGTTTGNLGKWPSLPKPVMRVRATRLWLADDIREFRKAREERDAAQVQTSGVL
jgi:hypothetical protein